MLDILTTNTICYLCDWKDFAVSRFCEHSISEIQISSCWVNISIHVLHILTSYCVFYTVLFLFKTWLLFVGIRFKENMSSISGNTVQILILYSMEITIQSQNYF